eukprot:4311803-Pyramimonas_sp.AAC.2
MNPCPRPCPCHRKNGVRGGPRCKPPSGPPGLHTIFSAMVLTPLAAPDRAQASGTRVETIPVPFDSARQLHVFKT